MRHSLSVCLCVFVWEYATNTVFPLIVAPPLFLEVGLRYVMKSFSFLHLEIFDHHLTHEELKSDNNSCLDTIFTLFALKILIKFGMYV